MSWLYQKQAMPLLPEAIKEKKQTKGAGCVL